jgi:hypothetical protein
MSSDEAIYLKAPSLTYKFPDGFPAVERLGIEKARREANRRFENTGIFSYDDFKASRTEWFWSVMSAAATAVGRAGAMLQWDAKGPRKNKFTDWVR